MVKSNELYSVQSYLEKVTHKCFIPRGDNDTKIISEILVQERYNAPKRFALKNVKEMVESNLNVVLVQCYSMNKDGKLSSKLWWYEIPKKAKRK